MDNCELRYVFLCFDEDSLADAELSGAECSVRVSDPDPNQPILTYLGLISSLQCSTRPLEDTKPLESSGGRCSVDIFSGNYFSNN